MVVQLAIESMLLCVTSVTDNVLPQSVLPVLPLTGTWAKENCDQLNEYSTTQSIAV